MVWIVACLGAGCGRGRWWSIWRRMKRAGRLRWRFGRGGRRAGRDGRVLFLIGSINFIRRQRRLEESSWRGRSWFGPRRRRRSGGRSIRRCAARESARCGSAAGGSMRGTFAGFNWRLNAGGRSVCSCARRSFACSRAGPTCNGWCGLRLRLRSKSGGSGSSWCGVAEERRARACF